MIIKNSLISTASQALGRLPNFVLPLAFLTKFGGSITSDIMFLGFAIAFFFGTTLANAATDGFTSKLTVSRHCETDKLWACVTVLLSALSFVLVVIFSPGVDSLTLFVALASILLVYLGLLSSFQVSKLYFYGDFLTPGVTWSFRWLALLAPLTFDSVIPAACAFILLTLLADFLRFLVLCKAVYGYEPHAAATYAKVIRSGPVVWFMLSASLSGLNPLIDRLIASYLEEGAISQLEFIERIASIFLLLPTIGVIQVINVEVVSTIKDSKKWRYDRFLLAWFLGACFWSLLCIFFIVLLNRFGWQNYIDVGWVIKESLVYGVIILLSIAPSLFVGMICVRILLAINKGKIVLILSAASLLVNTMSSVLLGLAIGVGGILLATLITYSFTSIFLIWSCSKHQKLISSTP